MKLIILNGSPGVGKSTIATRLHAEIPSSVLIDIDALRRTIPDYREHREESSRLSYELAAKAIEVSLKEGKDVIVDKAISYADTLDAFVAAGKKEGADIYEFLLLADKETVLTRAGERGYKPGSLLTPQRVEELWVQADALHTVRPGAIIIDTTRMSAEEVFGEVEKAVNGSAT